MSFLFNRNQSTLPEPVPNDALQQQIDGMMTPEQLAKDTEFSIGGKSALMHVAENLTKNIQAAERQHATSLQEVVDANSNATSKITLAFDEYQKTCEAAAQMVAAAHQKFSAAMKAHVEDSIDTNQMVSKLRDIRIKNPLLDKGNTIQRRSNLPRAKDGKKR